MKSVEISDSIDHITESAIKGSATALIPSGSVLMVVRSGILARTVPIGITTRSLTVNQDLKALVPGEHLDPWFLYYALKSCEQGLLGTVTRGATVHRLGSESIKSLRIPLPPLEEQKRIVAILDAAFADIDVAQLNVRTMGTATSEIIDGFVMGLFEGEGSDWARHPLIEVCDYFYDSAHRTPKYSPIGRPALRPRDVVGGQINFERVARVSDAEFQSQCKRYEPTAGDIVYSRELSLGWAAIVPEAHAVCLSQGMCVFGVRKTADATYMTTVLNSSFGRRQALSAAVGTAHPHLNLGDIKAIQIPVPPRDRQEAVMLQIEAVSSQVDRLQRNVDRSSDCLVDLRRSLLHQAFSGQL